MHMSMGLGDPHISSMPQLEYVVKGMKKKTASRAARVRRPITPQILHRMKQVWQLLKDRHNSSMLWAAACMCFIVFLRSGEVVVPSDADYDSSTHLSFGDVRVDSVDFPQYVEVRIKVSKGFLCSWGGQTLISAQWEQF